MGYLLAIIIGLTLGLIGGGGSVLTVPVLVYVMGISPVSATAYSLFIVGLASLFGARKYYKAGDIAIHIGVVFSIPAFLGVFISRKFLLPNIPEVLGELGTFVLTKDIMLMLFFAFIMLLAAFSMIFVKQAANQEGEKNFSYWKVGAEGIIVGIITGIVGAGGGFLIIPALVLLTGLPMKKAVGTSLMIIAVKSLFGFLGEWGNEMDWVLLGTFSMLAIGGIYLGTYLSRFIEGNKLKKSFGIFILLMAVLIILKETVLV